MKITSCQITKTKYMQIYLTKEEFEKQETKEMIEKYKKEKYRVSIFIDGKENYPEILKKVVAKQAELATNVC
ncbi:MAG: hypothetical protein IJE05_03020 [Clostridia bacterium]|nr:hypothetical protein [Clostridia bacterium]